MVAYSKGFAALVHRYNGHSQPIAVDQNVWDSVPWNNERLCSLMGIPFAPDQPLQGFSTPPSELPKAHWSSLAKAKWAEYLPKVIKMLRFLDAQYAQDVADRSHTLEAFQKTYWSAPGKEEWDWMWNEVARQEGGLTAYMEETMLDLQCDAAAAYRKIRKAEKKKWSNEFREKHVKTNSAFDPVWTANGPRVTRALCGAAAVDEDDDVDEDYITYTRANCNITFQKQMSKLKRQIGSLEAAEKGLEATYAEIHEQPSIGSLRMLNTYHQTITFAHRALGINVATDQGSWTERIEKLFHSFGAKIVDGRVRKITPTALKAHIVPWEQLKETVQTFIANLADRIASEAVADDMPADEDGGEGETIDHQLLFMCDAGVSEFRGRSIERLKSDLGITDGTLPGWPAPTPGRPSLDATWGQWVAVSKMIWRAFTETLGEAGDLTLLADQVGMGKTIVIIIFIEVLWMLRGLQQANPNWPDTSNDEQGKKWPKLLGARKYFMGLPEIPALPCIIVMQKGLIPQWRSELAKWVDPNEAHVLEYFGTEQACELFFMPDSLFGKAMQSVPERTIVLAHAKPVTAEMRFRMTHQRVSFARGEPCTSTPKHLKHSIFGQQWLFGVIKEAHQFRVNGHSQKAMTTLMRQCKYTTAVTATPVHTHTRDLLSLGRMVGVKGFTDDAGAALTKKINALIRTGEREWDNDPEHLDLRRFLQLIRKSSDNDEVSSSTSRALSPKVEEFVLTRNEDLKSFKSFWSSREALELLRKAHEPILIRRDERSVVPDGKKLIKHAKEIQIASWIAMDERTEAEMAAMTATKELRKDGRSHMDEFFTMRKQVLVHPELRRFALKGTEELCRMSPDEFAMQLLPDKAAYDKNASPKLRRVVRITEHHLGQKNTLALPLEWDKSGKEIPSSIQLRPEDVTKTEPRRRKCVIYCHMSASWSLVARALTINGIPNVRINGTQDPEERDAAVRKFQSEDDVDVILISDVAAAGLNLQRGSIVIFVDHPWSDSEKRQIKGRVKHHGQDRQVIFYDLLVPDTSDEFLQGFAGGKGLMSGVYNRELSARGLEIVVSSEESDLEEEDDNPPPEPTAVPARSVARSSAPSGSKRAATKPPVPKKVVASAAASLPKETPQEAESDATELDRDLSPAALQHRPEDIKFKQIHPSVPEAGPRPRAGTKAFTVWEKQVIYALKALRFKIQTDQKEAQLARAKNLQLPPPRQLSRPKPRAVVPPEAGPSQPGTSDVAAPDSSVHVAKGKGRATKTGQSAPAATPVSRPASPDRHLPVGSDGEYGREDLTALQTVHIHKVIESGWTVQQAIESLARAGEPPFPPDVLEQLFQREPSLERQAQTAASDGPDPPATSFPAPSTPQPRNPLPTSDQPVPSGPSQTPQPSDQQLSSIEVWKAGLSSAQLGSQGESSQDAVPATTPCPPPAVPRAPLSTFPPWSAPIDPSKPRPTGKVFVPGTQDSMDDVEMDPPGGEGEHLSQELQSMDLSQPGGSGRQGSGVAYPPTQVAPKRPRDPTSPPADASSPLSAPPSSLEQYGEHANPLEKEMGDTSIGQRLRSMADKAKKKGSTKRRKF